MDVGICVFLGCIASQCTLPLLHSDGDTASLSDNNLAMHIKGFVLFLDLATELFIFPLS